MKKDINIEKERITITISCEPRKHSIDPRILVDYTKDVLSMIPEEYTQKVKLEQSPSSAVSNLSHKSGHSSTGVWVFEIEKAPPKKTTNRRKSSTRPRKTDILKK